jgi:hypothetical protein
VSREGVTAFSQALINALRETAAQIEAGRGYICHESNFIGAVQRINANAMRIGSTSLGIYRATIDIEFEVKT